MITRHSFCSAWHSSLCRKNEAYYYPGLCQKNDTRSGVCVQSHHRDEDVILRADIRVKLNLAEGTGRLDLSDCELDEVPLHVFELSNLTELSLAGNNLSYIPSDIGKLRRLEKLQLSGNRLRELPNEICLIDTLEGLWLHGNILESLPEDIGALLQLRQLAIAGNKLSRLPDSIGLLNALVELVAAGNVLEELPRSIGAMASLKVLDLHGNTLQSICETVGMLSSLEELWLQGNHELTSLPGALGSSLRKLSAADCSLTHVSPDLKEMRELQDLSLYGNNLEYFPPEILTAPRLKKVWLEGNPLSKENVTELVSTALKTPYFGLGLDHGQLADIQENQQGNILRSSIIKNKKGYFKLERKIGSHDLGEEPCSVLIVAFGSAPGTPNWGGALKRVRDDFDKESHANISFDVLYVVDPDRSWYSGGDEGFLEYDESLASVTSQYKHVLFIGDSMGATACLMFAKHASTVHAFCPQIDLSKSSIRPGQEEEWEHVLRDRVLEGVQSCQGDVCIHVGNWHHDVQQSNMIPTDMEHARVKIYSVDSHRLAIALDKSDKLVPIIQSSILHFFGLTLPQNIRPSNLL